MSIAVQELEFSYKEKNVLSNLSFQLESGQLLAVLGPNGVGKTTLFRCILGVLKPKKGSIFLDGEETKKLSAKELAHRIAYIPQTHGHVFDYSVRDMVLMGTSHRVSAFAAPGKKERQIAEEALAKVGIEQLASKNYTRLSGGEQQLVLIARALAQQTKILLMDEPTSNLDYGNQTRVLEQVHLLSKQGYTIMLSTHNPQHAFWYADQILALKDGKVEAFGTPNAMLTEELVFRLYGIQVQFLQTENGCMILPKR